MSGRVHVHGSTGIHIYIYTVVNYRFLCSLTCSGLSVSEAGQATGRLVTGGRTHVLEVEVGGGGRGCRCNDVILVSKTADARTGAGLKCANQLFSY